MKVRCLFGVIMMVFFLCHSQCLEAASNVSDIQLEDVDSENGVTSETALDDEETGLAQDTGDYQRSESVSQYGTFKIFQTPIEWAGKGLDGIVTGIQKGGSALISLSARPFQKANQKK